MKNLVLYDVRESDWERQSRWRTEEVVRRLMFHAFKMETSYCWDIVFESIYRVGKYEGKCRPIRIHFSNNEDHNRWIDSIKHLDLDFTILRDFTEDVKQGWDALWVWGDYLGKFGISSKIDPPANFSVLLPQYNEDRSIYYEWVRTWDVFPDWDVRFNCDVMLPDISDMMDFRPEIDYKNLNRAFTPSEIAMRARYRYYQIYGIYRRMSWDQVEEGEAKDELLGVDLIVQDWLALPREREALMKPGPAPRLDLTSHRFQPSVDLDNPLKPLLLPKDPRPESAVCHSAFKVLKTYPREINARHEFIEDDCYYQYWDSKTGKPVWGMKTESPTGEEDDWATEIPEDAPNVSAETREIIHKIVSKDLKDVGTDMVGMRPELCDLMAANLVNHTFPTEDEVDPLRPPHRRWRKGGKLFPFDGNFHGMMKKIQDLWEQEEELLAKKHLKNPNYELEKNSLQNIVKAKARAIVCSTPPMGAAVTDSGEILICESRTCSIQTDVTSSTKMVDREQSPDSDSSDESPDLGIQGESTSTREYLYPEHSSYLNSKGQLCRRYREVDFGTTQAVYIEKNPKKTISPAEAAARQKPGHRYHDRVKGGEKKYRSNMPTGKIMLLKDEILCRELALDLPENERLFEQIMENKDRYYRRVYGETRGRGLAKYYDELPDEPPASENTASNELLILESDLAEEEKLDAAVGGLFDDIPFPKTDVPRPPKSAAPQKDTLWWKDIPESEIDTESSSESSVETVLIAPEDQPLDAPLDDAATDDVAGDLADDEADDESETGLTGRDIVSALKRMDMI